MSTSTETRQFYAKTREGCVLKILDELLKYYIKTKCVFKFGNRGIEMCAVSEDHRILASVLLRKEDFVKYECHKERTVELNIVNKYMALKSLKKKDILGIVIENKSPDFLSVQIKGDENSDHILSNRVKITDTRMTEVTDLDYSKGTPINILSSDFQRMCKSSNNMSKEMEIRSADPSIISFHCEGSDECDADNIFGDEEDLKKETRNYKIHLPTQVITKLSKVAGLSKNIKIYPTSEDLPLYFEINLGSLGRLDLYVKSNEQLLVKALDK